MAIRADRTIVRDLEIGVVEGRPQPGRGCMAGIAGCRIACRDVVRHRAAQRLCAIPIRLMAAVAGRVR